LLPAFADACVVQLFDAEGHARRIAAFHAVPTSSEALERLCAACAAGTGPPGLAAILGVTEPRLVEAREWVEQATSDPERELLSQIDAASALGVPLRTRGRVLGLLTLLASPARPSFDEKELGFAVDLADRAAIAIDNALLLSEAQRINRIKDEFLALLSHELRTPLGAILLWTGLLETENLDAAPARAVEMIDRSTRQLSQLIGELLDVSRIVAGKLSLDPHATLLGSLVESAVEAQRPAAEAKGVLLRFMSAGSFPQAWADSNRLRQALDNLVVNAIKFTPAQGEIVVSLERLGNSARVRVRDTGAGMRAELLPLIFERFRQGDSSSRRGQGGLGLGLTIAQHIVHLHGGTISAWSEGEGRGSVFTMQIPLRLAPSAVVSSASDPREVDKPLAGHRVLVVDDHEDTLRGLSLALEHNGAEVLKASSVDEGLTGLAGFRPDVIVSDLAMPDRDGYDLIGAVRALAVDDGGTTPAVAVSAYASNEDRQRALDAGFQEHLAKPVDVPRLVQSLVRLMAAV
jgi:signal transduction histidine kinase/ActR/RegA family two-component response regulator